jgi:hypothetical protein
MHQPHIQRVAAERSTSCTKAEQTADSPRVRLRHSSLSAVLVVHSRSHDIRFRIVAAPRAPLSADLPNSLP